MNFGVHGRKFSSDRIEIIKQFFRELEKRKSRIFVSSKFHKVLGKAKISTRTAQVYEPGPQRLANCPIVIIASSARFPKPLIPYNFALWCKVSNVFKFFVKHWELED